MDAYHEFVRQEVLPRCRDDYRVPPELYALKLQDLGVDMPIDELTSRAMVAFKETQNEMGALAALVAKARELPSADYRDLLRELTEDVVVSVALAEQEVERYTTRAPGQATSYFCGYTRLLELRADAERILGDDFDRRAFNDFILDQGLLPPSLLRKAVLEDFVTESSSLL